MNIQDLFKGLSAYGKAHLAIFEHRLWPFLFVPGILSVLILTGIAVGGYFLIPDLVSGIESGLPDFLKGAVIFWVLTVLIWVVLILMGLFIFKYIVLILLSPALSYLSEVTEKKIYGTESPRIGIAEMLKDIWRALKLNLRNLFWELITILLLSIIPIVNAVAGITGFAVESYFAGFGLIDYTLERKRFTTSETIRWVKQRRMLTTGLGLGFMLLTLIPVIGWFLAPTYGTIASTIAVIEELDEGQKVS